MKSVMLTILTVVILSGCSAFRQKGDTYSGASCEQSFMHFNSYCTDKKLSKIEFEAEVEKCNNVLRTEPCDKEYADLLWCMSRVSPGQYYTGGGPYGGGGIISDGCDCSSFAGALKVCKAKLEYK